MSDPQEIFKKFGPSTRHILIAGQKIAQNMHSGIGSEHILLAMTITSGNLAYEILKENAINLDQVKMILNLNNIRTNITKGLSKEVKNLLISAGKKANILKFPTVESEHLLWAILQDKECRANQIISRIGVDSEELKEQLEEIFSEIPHLEMPDQPNPWENNNIMGSNPPGFQGFNIFGPAISPMNENKSDNKSSTPHLDQYGQDLTKMAQENSLDPVIGRSKEIARTIQILCRRNKNNPVLVGEPGVGKTAIVEGLAQKIIARDVPAILKNKRIINLDLSLLIAGTIYRGQFEDRIKKIIAEIIKNKNVIVFIDEIHTIIGAGSAEGSMDVANILKPALAKGQIRLIGATTTEEYRKHIEKDSALERRLQVVKVSEPNLAETIEILKGIKNRYQDHHKVKITDEAIISAANLSKRYISDRYLPDKAIDLIDEAAAAKSISSKVSDQGNEQQQLKHELAKTVTLKEKAVESQDYQKAAQLKALEINLVNKLQFFKNQIATDFQQSIDQNDIAEVVSMWTGIPLDSLIKKEQSKLLDLEKILKQKIIGQNEAISEIAKAIRRTKSGIANPSRPIATFIFLGPTGVGKSELAKVLAKEVFNNENALVKLDMSEFMEKHNLARLIGAPPGYVGYEDSGKLTETIRKQPYSVVLLDEIEKAHPEIYNILLQIMEDGYLTDAKGRKVNFRNCIIILTSNIGASDLSKQASIGFKAISSSQKKQAFDRYEEMKKTVLYNLKQQFKPELLNRLDKTIVFKPLDKQAIKKIVDRQIGELNERLKEKGINLEIEGKLRNYIAQHGFEPEFGARPIRRMISDMIENPLSDLILSGKISQNCRILGKLNKNKVKFNIM